MTTRPQLSRYCFAHPVDEGWVGLYTPFEHGVCFVPAATWDHLESGRLDSIEPDCLRELADKKLLVPREFDDTCLDRYRASESVPINTMFLVLLQQCNIDCKYCIVGKNVLEPSRLGDRMSVDTGIAAVRTFERLLDMGAVPEARVTYYGGEPTLNVEVIRATLPLVRSLRTAGLVRPVDAIMATNGFLYCEELADLFAEHGASICVSIDGRASEHDAARTTYGGGPTHREVLETIRRYRTRGVPVGLSCTIGRHNVEHLSDVARFFVRDLGIRDIGFQIPYQVPDGGNELYLSMAEATSRLLEACDVMIDELGVDEYVTLRRLESFINGRFRHRYCGATGGQIVVSPDGRLGPCHSLAGSDRFVSGSVGDPDWDPARDSLFEEWSSRTPVNMPECHGCAFISLCGGGCAYHALTHHGTIWARDPQACPHLRQLMAWILERLWRGRGLRPESSGGPGLGATAMA